MSGPATLGAAVVLGIVQGLTEFLPISSSGHLAAAQLMVPGLAFPGVTLELATHLGTTAAVLLYHRRLIGAVLRTGHPEALHGLTPFRWLLLLLVGTLPAALLGVAAEPYVRSAFESLSAIAAGLFASGLVLFASRLRRPGMRSIGVTTALVIGAAQATALFPGVSRSGITITVALLLGVSPRLAVPYSLLLSVPVVIGASVLDAAQAFAASSPSGLLFRDLVFATLSAGLVGYACIGLVHRATRTGWWHRFAWYCWFVALVLLAAARQG